MGGIQQAAVGTFLWLPALLVVVATVQGAPLGDVKTSSYKGGSNHQQSLLLYAVPVLPATSKPWPNSADSLTLHGAVIKQSRWVQETSSSKSQGLTAG